MENRKDEDEIEDLNKVSSMESIQHISKCVGGRIAAEQGSYSRKCIEMSVGGICPFNGIHNLCQRCKCVETRPDSSR